MFVSIKLTLILCYVYSQVHCETHGHKPLVALSSTDSIQFYLKPNSQINQNRNDIYIPNGSESYLGHPDPASSLYYKSVSHPKSNEFVQQILRRVHSKMSPHASTQLLEQSYRYPHEISKDIPLSLVNNDIALIKGQESYNYGNSEHHSSYHIRNIGKLQRFNVNNKGDQHSKINTLYPSTQQYIIPKHISHLLKAPEFRATQHGNIDKSSSLYSQLQPTSQIENYNLGRDYPKFVAYSDLATKEAQDYLNFMSTNEYFLPKLSPNYKQLDANLDQALLYHQPKELKQSSSNLEYHYREQQPVVSDGIILDNKRDSTHNQRVKIHDNFPPQNPLIANTAVVRGSYQTGHNVFVVNSDGNKAIKHIVSTPITSESVELTQTTRAPLLSAFQYNRPNFQAPDPLRFEFTESDAIRPPSIYTSAPQSNQFVYETIAPPHITHLNSSASPASEGTKFLNDTFDNSENDGDTTYSTSSKDKTSLQSTFLTTASTEAYCEKLCANVYNENDEIICATDGYMYTGEPQMNCYSSCLKISVSIKSKGACSSL